MLSRALLGVVRGTWVLLSAAVLVAAGMAWATYQDVDTGVRRSLAVRADDVKSTSGMNVLVMGLTTRRDLDGGAPSDEVLAALHAGDVDRGGYNANTLILLHVPSDGSAAVALSLPRDNHVPLLGIVGGPQHGKVKEAYGRAKEAEERRLVLAEVRRDPADIEWLGREAGRRAQVETVGSSLGVPVDHIVEVSMVGFYRLAEALGGVEVCLNAATSDEYSGADFPAGRQHLTAAQAMAFVRQRHGLANADLDRVRRQQAFISAVMHRIRSQGVNALGPVAEVAKQHVVLSADWDILSMAQGTSGIRFHTLPLESDPTADAQPTLRAAVTAALTPPAATSGAATEPSPIPCVD
ncbi:LCP family protein required for cell wall assembly [Saccharothrix ecbatanensis]|uniref:LCP family protein required for cell wall assembly n=1 Tax=Saccharothrix ecbatanensis TaxID=1105145 RepID=A0A7W9HTR8_9PSEU|nr:LCP family protein [Saccharothrix ecbatanensis]MBB5808367.1 LCP family protein required for cell wall assembly [Saccharothrix ecbatanensis]